MPYPKIWNDEQIARLYEEYIKSDEDLKTFCQKRGLIYTTIFNRFQKLERGMSRRSPPATPDAVVADAVQARIAQEARSKVESMLKTAGAIQDEYVAIATEEGWLNEIEKHPPDKEIRKWYEGYKKAKELEAENDELRIQLNYYKRRADPFQRLEIALNAYINYLAIAVIAKRMKTNIPETKQTFHNMITNFLKGEVEYNG
jgi:hypothetical protein